MDRLPSSSCTAFSPRCLAQPEPQPLGDALRLEPLPYSTNGTCKASLTSNPKPLSALSSSHKISYDLWEVGSSGHQTNEHSGAALPPLLVTNTTLFSKHRAKYGTHSKVLSLRVAAARHGSSGSLGEAGTQAPTPCPHREGRARNRKALPSPEQQQRAPR